MVVDEYQPISALLKQAPEFMHPFIDEPVLYILEDNEGEIIEMQGSLDSLSLDPAVLVATLKEAEQFGSMLSAACYHCAVYKLGDYPWLKQEPFPYLEKSLLL